MNIFKYRLQGFCGLLLAVLLLTACTKSRLYDRRAETKGCVRIYPEHSGSLPMLFYHFYDVDEIRSPYVASSYEKGHFNRVVPAATYQVLGVNTDVLNITFTHMGSYEEATAIAQTVPTVRNALYTQPSMLYSTVVSELEVTVGDTIERYTSTLVLTKTVRFMFELDANLIGRVFAIEGTLNGIYPAVCLHNGVTTVTPDAPGGISVTFSATITDNLELWQAPVNLFGVIDPQSGQAYRSELNLIVIIDGEPIPVAVDISEELSAMMAENGGVIPIDVELSIRIKETPLGELTSQITGWEVIDDSKTIIIN